MRKMIDMAEEAGMTGLEDGGLFDNFLVFEALVRADEREETNRRANASWPLMCEKMVAAEREACASIVENAHTPDCGGWTAEGIADAIRARGETK